MDFWAHDISTIYPSCGRHGSIYLCGLSGSEECFDPCTTFEELENRIQDYNNGKYNKWRTTNPPIYVLIVYEMIGKEILDIAERNDIKCIVCSGIKERKKGIFSSEPEFDKEKTGFNAFDVRGDIIISTIILKE